MNYEEKIKELENIINELEKDLPMEKALELYKNGVTLVKDVMTNLEEIKGSIYKVKQDLDKYIEEKIG